MIQDGARCPPPTTTHSPPPPPIAEAWQPILVPAGACQLQVRAPVVAELMEIGSCKAAPPTRLPDSLCALTVSAYSVKTDPVPASASASGVFLRSYPAVVQPSLKDSATRQEEWERNIFLCIFLLIAFLVVIFVFTIGLHQGVQSVVQFIHKHTPLCCSIVPSFLAMLSSTRSPVVFPWAGLWELRNSAVTNSERHDGQQAFFKLPIQMVAGGLSWEFYMWLLWA